MAHTSILGDKVALKRIKAVKTCIELLNTEGQML